MYSMKIIRLYRFLGPSDHGPLHYTCIIAARRNETAVIVEEFNARHMAAVSIVDVAERLEV